MDYSEFAEKYKIHLTEQQETAVKTVDGNVLLLAVPGSGKTTVLVTRLAYMAKCCGIPPENILTMTYTVAATNDMKRRYRHLFDGEPPLGFDIRTINSLCCDIIRRYEVMLNTRAFPLVEDDERIQIISRAFREVNNEYPTDADKRDIATSITYVKNMQLTDAEIEHVKCDADHFPQIYKKYKEYMNERQKMDYDDQLRYAYAILRKYPDILLYYRQKYRYICLDEAQDTSKIQHTIIRLLAGSDGNVFMVGDEDQSIYGFRAAYPEALVNFSKEYSNAKVLLMEENFRSTGNIVAAADSFIRQNSERHEKHMKAAAKEEGSPICQIWLRDRASQYDYIMERVLPCESETAILYRDNASALPLMDLLLRNNISYRSRGIDNSFFSSKIVKDISDIIVFAQNQTDSERFLSIYYKINSYVDRKNALAASEYGGNAPSLLSWLYANSSLKENIKKRQIVLMHQLDELLHFPADEAIRFIDETLGYGKYLEREKMNRNNLDILRLIGEKEPSPLKLLERLDFLNQAVQEGTDQKTGNLVLSTIHSAKGLEYQTVYLLDVIDGILPQNGPRGDIAELEEERRLFYVGMTRAKDELYVFRFKKAGLASEFSKNIFDYSFAPSPPKSEANKAEKLKAPDAAKEELLQKELSLYAPGTHLYHKKFGEGVIAFVDDDSVASVSFGAKGEKCLLLKSCIEKGIISIK